MLLSLSIRDFAIVDKIDLEFGPGMTVLTGETGAGKSILIDAIGLVLGERGGAQLLRDGAKRAEFSAEFDVSALDDVRRFLEEHSLDQDDACLLRRVVNADGRSRAFINGTSVPLSQLKTLGELLLDIHGQHFHQSLGRKPVQRDLLDYYAEVTDQRAEVEAAFRSWRQIEDRLRELLDDDADRASRIDLLTFQLQELDSLDLAENEFDELSSERRKLANSNQLAEGVGSALARLFDNDEVNANSLIAAAIRSIEPLADCDPALEPTVELLRSAGIQATEAADALRRYSDGIDADPARRDWVEQRLDAIQAIARKHRVEPDEITALHNRLQSELDELDRSEERGRALEAEAGRARASYFEIARALSAARADAAQSFSTAVTEAMAGLGMPDGRFEIRLTPLKDDLARPWGRDDIEFLISANPGQAPQPLAKVASGGELSRMSLSIQVIASGGSAIPTMIFDEVDAGVGGGVAEMVGRRLQELGVRRQVFCVTHLPQVASLADRHFRVAKVTDGKSTRTRVEPLGEDERVEELARMLGGVEITSKTLAHAAEMLAAAARKTA